MGAIIRRHLWLFASIRRSSSVSKSSLDASFDDYENRKQIISSQPSFYPPYRSVAKNASPTLRIPEYIEKYHHIVPSDTIDTSICVEGRILSIRRMSKSLIFFDVIQDDRLLQVVAAKKTMNIQDTDKFNCLHSNLRKGDHVSILGYPSRTKAGELSIRAQCPLTILSPCVSQPAHRLEHRDKTNANRVLNYLVNPETKMHIITKSKIIAAIRNYLTRKDFLEVQTPILAGDGTGANAQPFTTRSIALDRTLSLRVAPELWLKKFVISGFDKVFEIGQNFRNEGIDGTHNPEFTSCEFYRSHTDLDQLMKMTEEIFHEIIATVKPIETFSNLSEEDIALFKSLAGNSYRKYEFIPTIEKITGLKLPAELTSESLVSYMNKLGIEIPAQKSPANLLDHLSGLYLEPLSQSEPIFIYNQPALMSPLAKSMEIEYDSGHKYEISLRFEMFIKGKEYVNSYEEENSPFAQLEKFQNQLSSKDKFHDHESLVPDWAYVKSMEYGLPPTGGWGCGIDRLAMLFSGTTRIEDVLAFGSLKDVVKQ